MHILAVIPARGGSKGIPRKNMRLLHGKPLIAYAIENAIACSAITDVVVSSDSDEILAFAQQYEGVLIFDRDSKLAQDAVTLDPVVYDAVLRGETERGVVYDAVITLQPTSPLLTTSTLDAALSYFEQSGSDTVISVVNAPHLSWKMQDDRCIPAYEERLNRQQLPENYLETGAFLVSKRSCITEKTRIGEFVSVYEVPESEAVDIDTCEDWVVCEALLSRKNIVFRVDGYKELGLGHIFRALTLAYTLTEHNVTFICNGKYRLGVEKLREANMNVVEVANDAELIDWLSKYQPDVYIHDCLDTEVQLMKAIRPFVGRLITFEDLGDGARYADAVVNAIYEGASSYDNVFTGKDYVALRDEFLTAMPKSFSPEVNTVLVMFGGTDPTDLSSRLYALAQDYNKSMIRVRFNFILGSGYEGSVTTSDPSKGIFVVKDVVRVSNYMKLADLAFSSQGRTTFELASMGVPTIVLAQNKREQLHRFAQMDNGFINLGLGDEVSDEDIRSAFEWLLDAVSVRREMHKLMLDNDLRSGITRVKRIILGETL